MVAGAEQQGSLSWCSTPRKPQGMAGFLQVGVRASGAVQKPVQLWSSTLKDTPEKQSLLEKEAPSRITEAGAGHPEWFIPPEKTPDLSSS